MIRQNRPILSLSDFLRATQEDFGIAPIVDPNFRPPEEERFGPFDSGPFGNNFAVLQDSRLPSLSDLSNEGFGLEPDVPNQEFSFANALGIAGDLFGVMSAPATAFGKGLFDLAMDRDRQNLTALGRLGRQVGDRIDFGLAIDPNDPFSPFDQAPLSDLFDLTAPDEENNPAPDEFDFSLGDPEDFGGGIGPDGPAGPGDDDPGGTDEEEGPGDDDPGGTDDDGPQ